jgi:diacylglycerol kinase (ATP)
MPEMRTSIAVVFNPSARGEKARRLHGFLKQLEGQCSLHPTLAPGHATELASQLVRGGTTTVVAAGGDGTVNEVINGLAADPSLLPGVRLGLLPVGTMNVYARELRVPLQWDKAWEVIRHGREHVVDLPYVEWGEQTEVRRRYFAQLGGAGLDSRAIAMVSWRQKKLLGPVAYVLAGVRAALTRVGRVRVECQSPKISAEGELILVGNGRLYGGSFELFSGAKLEDGLLDVRVFPKAGFIQAARVGCQLLMTGRSVSATETCFRAQEFTLSCPDPLPFELDGENVGLLPATFRVMPRLLRVLVPAG